MQDDIIYWLEELGLAQYAEAFLRNDIDLDVVRDLTDGDLRELGVSMGHRKILLRAIARHAARTPTRPTTPIVGAGERRQLTVMFCDLVNSTGLAERHDPEVLKAATYGFRECCGQAVARYGGIVAGFRGDGLLIYFGYPEANEHDPERALRAGLEIIDALADLETEVTETLECRIGIATGHVIVGDLVGSGLSQERDVTGVVPNLAARLEQIADPGTIVVSDGTRQLVGDLFEFVDLGHRSLKGLLEPQRVWRVERESAAESRFEATHAAGELSPLVGRERELATLLEHWERARGGHGRAVLLSGEAGIGKSRMIHALREQLAARGTDHRLVRYFCLEYHKNSALFPVISHLERAAGFNRGDPVETKLTKLETLLAEALTDVAEVAPLYAGLLSVPADERYPAMHLSPNLEKERTLAALEKHLRALSSSRPLLVVVEDMHWGDPTTGELLERVLGWIEDAPILLVVTARPEFSPAWARNGALARLPLERLSHDKSIALLSHFSRRRTLTKEIVWEIVAKSDGIPLFLEEIAKAVIAPGVDAAAASDTAARGARSVPDTLQDSLAARLDRLPRAKRVAQIGAAIGRQFSYELVAAVSPLPSEQLLQALDQLTAGDVLRCDGQPPKAQYTFKHALLQDWAYENQLMSRRAALHAAIAQILEDRFPEEVGARPEVVAHHLSEAGDDAGAIRYWQLAARRSTDRAAYAETLEHLERAFEHLEKLDDDAQRKKLELELQVARGLGLEGTLGYGAPEVKQTYERARELCAELDETVDRVPVLLGLYVYHLVRAHEPTDLATSRELAAQCVRLARDSGSVNYLIESYAALGYALCYLGELHEARRVLEECVRLRELEWSEVEYTITAQDPAVASLSLLSVVLWLLGLPDESLAQLEHAFELAERIGSPINHALALAHAAQLHQLRREPAKAAECALQGLGVAREHGYPVWEAHCAMHLGVARAVLEDLEGGIQTVVGTLEAYRAGGGELNRPYYLAGIAQAELAAGRAQQALAHVSEAIAQAQRTGEAYFLPLFHQVRGECYARIPGCAAEADAELQRACESAAREQAKMLELRALLSLRTLSTGDGHGRDGDGDLERLVGELVNAGETLDLEEARSLCADSKSLA